MDEPQDRHAGVRLAYIRGQLEAPVDAVREYTKAAAVRVPADSPLRPDFDKLLRFAEELGHSILRVLESPLPTDDPKKLQELRHDLRGGAARIVTQCDLLIQDEIDNLPDGTLRELKTIHAAAWRVIDLINSLITADPSKANGEELDLEGLMRTISSGPHFRRVDPGRILIADDSPDNRDLLTRLLVNGGGHDVTQVEDGEAALAALETGSFDVLLLDVMMPGLNGFHVLERVREHPTWKHLPVIMMSALGGDGAIIAGVAGGADDYIRRPFNPTLLQARINTCIERKRFRDREVAYQQQIDKLIRALFPPEVADEVRENGTIPPRRHDGVGVLFLDVVGFTKWCEARRDRPDLVTEALRFLIQSLEEVAQKHGVLKIKTIGDAFLGTTGLVRPDPDPVGTLVRCGTEMLERVATHPEGWQVRMGIHIGPVIAGIIGTTQFQFDVFGSTVNLASRLQSLAHPGGMVLSETAWALVSSRTRGSQREEEVKGVGRVSFWDVELASQKGS